MSEKFSSLAKALREMLGIPLDVYLNPIEVLYRAQIAGYIAGFRFLPDDSLPYEEAHWDPISKTINLRQSLHDRLLQQDDQARFTVFHELAHAFLGHQKRSRKPNGNLQFGRYTDFDERDADEFAMAFAAPVETALAMQLQTPEAIAQTFGIPMRQAHLSLVLVEKELRKAQLPAAGDTDDAGGHDDTDFDSYADAMIIMARNARAWNS